jgi:hypothetical protein
MDPGVVEREIEPGVGISDKPGESDEVHDNGKENHRLGAGDSCKPSER